MKNKNTCQTISRIGISAALLFTSHLAFASTTRVGNGDDGKDLEGGAKIQYGPIWDARLIAIERLKNLNIPGIAGLGLLIPEVEKTELILAQEDIAPLQHETGSEISTDQKLVYARTFAEPHAATRFFPSALKLDREQLIALHIHEGLHRSLPEEYREDEELVSAITLSITTQGASYDRVKRVAGVWMNKPAANVSNVAESKMSMPSTPIETNYYHSKDEFGYTFENFGNKGNVGEQTSIHIFNVQKTFLNDSIYQPTLGLRLSSYGGVGGANNRMKMGPVDLSAQAFLLNQERFQVAGFLSNSVGTMDSTRNSRDVLSIGIKTRKDNVDFLYETSFKYSPSSVGQGGDAWCPEQSCRRTFKDVVSLSFRGGYQGTRWLLLGTTDLHLSQGWENNYETFQSDEYQTSSYKASSGRFNLLTVGPEVGWKFKSGQVSLYGKHQIASSVNSGTRDTSDLGDVMGRGYGTTLLGLNFNLEM